MLNAAEVLREIQRGGDLEVTHLARRLAAAPGAVRRMLSFLREQAYLEEVEPPCPEPGSGCRFCPMKSHCGARNGPVGLKIYRLTEKGVRLIEDPREKEGSR